MSHIAFQYAEALFQLAHEEDRVESLHAHYQALSEGLDEDIRRFLRHPKIGKNDKKEILAQAVDDSLLRHFLFVLVDNVRIDLLDDCLHELTTIINNQNRVMDVTVHSQHALSSADLKTLQANIGKKHNRTVRLENVVDPSIIGGIRIEYEGHVLDQTINHYLHALKHNLTK